MKFECCKWNSVFSQSCITSLVIRAAKSEECNARSRRIYTATERRTRRLGVAGFYISGTSPFFSSLERTVLRRSDPISTPALRLYLFLFQPNAIPWHFARRHQSIVTEQYPAFVLPSYDILGSQFKILLFFTSAPTNKKIFQILRMFFEFFSLNCFEWYFLNNFE